MPEEPKNTEFLKRYLALKALRENIFFTRPSAYSFLDIAEDLPGRGKALGPFLADALPSAGLISRDPDKRKLQIAKAVNLVNHANTDKGELKRQALSNAFSLGVGGIPSGIALSGLINLLGVRSPFKGGLRSPVALGKNISKLKASRNYQKALLTRMANDGVKGGVAGAITGAAVPIATSYAQPKKEDVAAAAKILQDAPVASSLPGGDVLSINNSLKTSPMSTATNVSAAGLSGLGAGALGTFIPPTLDAPQVIAKHLKSNKFSLSPLKALFVRAAKKHLLGNALILGGLGASAGYALSNNKTHSNELQQDLVE
jgi:hypothetical protein